MNIAPVTSINFSATPKVIKYYVPGKNDTTLRCFLEATSDKTTGIKYDVLKKGKIIETQEFRNKRGFDANRYATIIDQIQTKVREGFDFLYETLNAQLKSGV